METFLIRALQLMMSLSLLVIIHEGGHFFFAKLFKVRVTKFYLFFNGKMNKFRRATVYNKTGNTRSVYSFNLFYKTVLIDNVTVKRRH
jgi:hypothetical protein